VSITTTIPAKFGFDPVNDVQVLTPMHRGLLGAASLNAELQALLDPQGSSIVHGSRLFRTGDKVMQMRNNYDLEVFNGDIGRIETIDEEDRTVSVVFDGRSVTYERADLDELVLAYACANAVRSSRCRQGSRARDVHPRRRGSRGARHRGAEAKERGP